MAYLSRDAILEDYAEMLMMVLPDPRLDYYESADFSETKKSVLDYSNKIVQAMGLYPVSTQTELLQEMALFSAAILIIGIIFNILIIMFIMISILLIYSLLMITTETKTFDIGIMRLLGLNSRGFVAMILTQAVLFVIPSIILAYACSYPALYFIFMKLFNNEMGEGGITFVPGAVATV